MLDFSFIDSLATLFFFPSKKEKIMDKVNNWHNASLTIPPPQSVLQCRNLYLGIDHDVILAATTGIFSFKEL